MIIEPGRVLSHYTLVAKIAAGGMGEVYRARDDHLPRDVAIKILPSDALVDDHARKRFRREAETLSKLNHAHIATIYDFDTQDGLDFLVMEYVEGTTLAGVLRAGPMPIEEVLRIGSDIAAALEEAHKRGVVHRDLKPGNVGLTARGQVKVLDFGLAQVLRPVAAASTTESLTGAPGGPAGTLPYMAPEHLRGAPADHRSDLYALGVVLYEMTAGRRPFEGGLAPALIDDILHRIPPRPTSLRPDAPQGLESIILKCLEKDPGLRYQSAQEALVDLRRMTSPSLGFETMRARSRPIVKTRWLLGAGALVVLAAGLVAGLNVRGLRDRLIGRTSGMKIESVVALPSEVLATEEDAFLADAVPRTLSTYLSQIKGLDTKMPPTSIEMERIRGNLEKAAKAYGVGALVLSAVRVRSDDIHLSVQLVAAGSRRMIWSREFDGRRQAYLELVRAAAEGLRDAIHPSAAPVLTTAPGGSEAEILFQRGLYHSSRYTNQHRQGDYELARAAFEQGLRMDPKRADAAAEIARLCLFKIESGAALEEWLPQMKNWARRALEIDPRNGRAWASLTFASYYSNPDPLALIPGSLRAAFLAPKDGFCQDVLGIAVLPSSRMQVEAYLLAWRSDPLYLYPPINAAQNLGWLGRPADGLPLLSQVFDLEPDMPWALGVQSQLLTDLGRNEEAAAINSRIKNFVAQGRLPDDFYRESADLLTVAVGTRQEREQATSRLMRLYAKPAWSAQLLIMILTRSGEIGTAFEVMENAANTLPYDWLMLCPDLGPLRGEERFDRIASKAHAQFERMLTLFEEARARGEFPEALERPLALLLADLRMSPGKAGD